MAKAKTQFCGDKEYLSRYLQEKLGEDEESSLMEHIGDCEDCQQVLERLAAGEQVWDRLGEHLSLAVDEAEETRELNERERWLVRLKAYLSPTDDPQMMGRLGSYEVCGLIGAGSTGIVLKAFEPRLNRFVAIKILSPAYSSLGASRKRFEREGRAVAAVANDHVVPIFAVDEHRGIPFIVMQYVPGGSLLQRIQKEGPLDTCEVTRIGLQVALGLAAAHAQGIVHRDVKPANVLLEDTIDRAMVTDFGLARVTDEATMTRSGTIAGTPQYMSPEQARGDAVDHRTDLFSLGSLMYAACTARPPFRAETVYGVINRVCETEPRPIQALNPKIEKWLVSFIDRLMAKGAGERFQSAQEVAEILSAELAHLQNPTAVPRPKRPWAQRSPAPATQGLGLAKWVALAIVLCLGGYAAFMFAPARENAVVSAPLQQPSPKAKKSTPKEPSGKEPTERVSKAAAEPEAEPDAEPAVAPSITLLPTGEVSLPDVTHEWSNQEDEWNTDTTVRYEHKVEHVLSTDLFQSVSIEAGYGDVLVRPGKADELRIAVLHSVDAESQPQAETFVAEHKLQARIDDNQLMLMTGEIDDEEANGIRRVLLKVTMPSDYALELEAASGDITVGSMQSDIEVRTLDGCIELARIEGDLYAKARHGDIRLDEGCTGDVDFRTSGGDVSIARIEKGAKVVTSGGNIWFRGADSPGKVYLQTSGGNIEVEEFAGRLGAFASDGNVFATVTRAPAANSMLAANAGDVYIEFSDEIDLDLQYEGDLEADEEIRSVATTETEDSEGGTLSLNDGGPMMHVYSTLGAVRLARFQPEQESLGGSGPRHLGEQGLGGSGPGSTSYVSSLAKAKMEGPPRAGGLATIALPSEEVMDGYTLYLPVSYDKHDGTYPVIVYLQGAYGVGGEITNVNDWGMTRLVRDESDLSTERNRLLLDSFIIVSPHIRQGQYYHAPEVVGQILDTLVADYKADANRICLTGLSRGGHGTWGLAAKLPGRFAAIAPIAGSPDEMDDFRKVDDIGVWISHNSGDAINDYGPVENVIEQIEARSDERFLRVPGVQSLRADAGFVDERLILTSAPRSDHDAWTDVYTSPEFYQWLLERRLDKE